MLYIYTFKYKPNKFIMNPIEAVQVLEQALNAANLKGVYSLADANKVLVALNTIHNLDEVKASIPELVTE